MDNNVERLKIQVEKIADLLKSMKSDSGMKSMSPRFSKNRDSISFKKPFDAKIKDDAGSVNQYAENADMLIENVEKALNDLVEKKIEKIIEGF